jgi:DNA-binding PadR family transcriptional regulator
MEMRGETYDFPNWRFAEGEPRGGRGGGRSRGRRHGLSPEDIERLVAFREMRGGPFGGGRGGRGGRRRRGDVRTAVLLLLAEEPRNGYQLMQTIEERSDGNWRPSPGSVYPTLSQLEDEGLIRSTELDGNKVFEITDTGRQQLAERGDAPAPWEQLDDDGRSARDLRGTIGAIAAATMQVARMGSEDQVEKAHGILTETRRKLYRILAEDDDT